MHNPRNIFINPSNVYYRSTARTAVICPFSRHTGIYHDIDLKSIASIWGGIRNSGPQPPHLKCIQKLKQRDCISK